MLFYETVLHFQLPEAKWVWDTFKLAEVGGVKKKLPFLFLYACKRTTRGHRIDDLKPTPSTPVDFPTKKSMLGWLGMLVDVKQTTVDPSPDGYRVLKEPSTLDAAIDACEQNDDRRTVEYLITLLDEAVG